MDEKQSVLDPPRWNAEPAAFDKRMIDEKRRRASVVLYVPKPVVDPSDLFGWEPSPLFRSPKRMEIRVDRSLDPGDLKRILEQACRTGGLDPGSARKIMAEAVLERGLEPRALKKMLALAHEEATGEGGLPDDDQTLLLRKKKELIEEALDQQQRDISKQPANEGRNGKPFAGIAPGF